MSLKMLPRSASVPSTKSLSARTKGVSGAQSPAGSYGSAHVVVRLSFGLPGTMT